MQVLGKAGDLMSPFHDILSMGLALYLSCTAKDIGCEFKSSAMPGSVRLSHSSRPLPPALTSILSCLPRCDLSLGVVEMSPLCLDLYQSVNSQYFDFRISAVTVGHCKKKRLQPETDSHPFLWAWTQQLRSVLTGTSGPFSKIKQLLLH